MMSCFIFELTISWKGPLLTSCGESQLLPLFHPHKPSLPESVRTLNERLPFGASDMEEVNKTIWYGK
jgi:hypothetical protein